MAILTYLHNPVFVNTMGADNLEPRQCKEPGPWFNLKMLSYPYKKPHCGDKMILPTQ